MKSFNGKILLFLLVLTLAGGNAYGYNRVLGTKNLMNNPFEKFEELSEEFFNNTFLLKGDVNTSFKIDVQDNKDEYMVEAELPGIEKKNINLSYENSNLIINVYSNKEVKEEDKNYIKRERNINSMTRALYLPAVVEDKISAKLDKGILTIILPKDKNVVEKKSIKIE